MPPSVEPAVAPALVLPPELTHRQAASALARLQQALAVQSNTALVVDASALTLFDTSALAVLLECRRAVMAQGKVLRVHGLPPALERMAVLYGVDSLLGAQG